jgi:pyruvate/2-oxoglutarate/acetoin dehydrogenase E1 component
LLTYGGNSRYLDDVLVRLADDEFRVMAVLPSLINRLDLDLLARTLSTASAGCIVLEESTEGFDWSAEIIASLHTSMGSKLPRVVRLSSSSTVIPAARQLEREMLPGAERVEAAVAELVAAGYSR